MLITGQIIHNRYRIIQLIGQGGFGAVYKAWDTSLNSICALKENTEISPASQRQFLHEATILANLRHPNLPRVTDYFILPGHGQYLVMDYINGEDLRTKLGVTGKPLAPGMVVTWISQVCDALIYMHQQHPPIIHRDLKPENILVTPAGQAILVDFGVAKTYNTTLRTTAGARAVTPGFSPPEQYGQGTTDARTDIYALGATLYILLTNQEPVESIQRTLRIQLLPPRQLNPGISTELESVILKAMEVYPGDRFQRVEDFKSSLLGKPSILPGLKKLQPAATKSSPRPTSPLSNNPQKLVRSLHLNSWNGILGALLVGIILLFLAVASFSSRTNRSASKASTLTNEALKTSVVQTVDTYKTELVLPTSVPTLVTGLLETSVILTADAIQTMQALAAGHTSTIVTPLRVTETPYLVPSITPNLTETISTPSLCDAASFVADITVSDNTVFLPGIAFTKIWRLRNTGTCTWTQKYQLVFKDGDAMGGPAYLPFPGNVFPGQTIDLSVNLVAPPSPGEYKGNWLLRNPAGVLFGVENPSHPFFVIITVK